MNQLPKSFETKSEPVDISELLEPEVNKLIFCDVEPDVFVSMPLWIAEQIINMNHLSSRLKDWAYHTLELAIDNPETVNQ